MNKPTLLILAAGMGSRYGGLKQIDAFGPNGEAIIEYSIYDAIRAGFGKVVFVIRSSFQDAFAEAFAGKFEDKIDVAYVHQDLHDVPSFFIVPADRKKPWGTAHAVWVARHEIDGPFGVINADDFYGRSSYVALHDFLVNQAHQKDYAVISYYLGNTLSDHGTVNRGVCHQTPEGNLSHIVETLKIGKDGGKASYIDDNGTKQMLELTTLVSMNMFGFLPSYFDYASDQFATFLQERGGEEKSEFFIPLMMDTLIKSGELNVKVIDTDASWFGVTYKEDKPFVQAQLNDLIAAGEYPASLWA